MKGSQETSLRLAKNDRNEINELVFGFDAAKIDFEQWNGEAVEVFALTVPLSMSNSCQRNYLVASFASRPYTCETSSTSCPPFFQSLTLLRSRQFRPAFYFRVGHFTNELP